MMLKDSGDYKMNPPIRAEEDRLALIEGIVDGTIDMIATDHAPHSAEEKSKGLKGSLNGIVGLETAFPILYTHLVKKGIITLEKLVDLMSTNPRKRFNIPLNGYCVWDLDKKYAINEENFKSKGKSCPFKGLEVYGERKITVINDQIVSI
jgi:dihydroorotase